MTGQPIPPIPYPSLDIPLPYGSGTKTLRQMIEKPNYWDYFFHPAAKSLFTYTPDGWVPVKK